MTETELLPVTQEDRDVAADMVERDTNGAHLGERSWHIRDGHLDGDYRVQAFARHRLASQPLASGDGLAGEREVLRKALHSESSPLYWALERGDEFPDDTLDRVLAALRAIAKENDHD